MTALQKALKKLERRISYLMIILFCLMSVIGHNWLANLGLVFFISLISSSRVSHVLTHYLLVPLMFCFNKAGSVGWERWSLRWTPIFKILFILATSLFSFDSDVFLFILFLIIIEEFSNYVISPKTTGAYGFQMFLKKCFVNYRNKVVFYGVMCFLSFLIFLAFIYNLFSDFILFEDNSIFNYFISLYALLLLCNWIFTFITFVISQFLVEDRKSVMLSDFVQWKTMFVCFFLFGIKANSQFSDVYFAAFFGSIVVCEYLIETISVYHESRKSLVSQLSSSPDIKQDFWLYYFLIIFSIFAGNLLILFLLFIIVLAEEFRKFLACLNSVVDLRGTAKGFWISNFNNDIYDLDVYKRINNKFRLSGFRLAITFRWFYFQNNQFLSLDRMISHSEFVLINLAISDYDIERRADDYNYIQIKTILEECVKRPFFLLVVLESQTFKREYLRPLDGRLLESWAHYEDVNHKYYSRGCREFYEVAYLFEYLDEKPFTSKDYLEEISIDTLRLNHEMREVIESLGMNVKGIYSQGLTPLLVLHRRTHEFSMIASRFMELLNLIEVAARWIMILERPRVINLNEEIQFSFGAVVSEIRTTSFAEVVLFENADELNEYKKILQTTFGYNQKENVRFRVIDFMNWVVFIRNKTRGHGSPSRVSSELYQLLEENTLRLLQAVAEQFDPELLMCSSAFYVMQRGMNFDFIYYNEQTLPEGVSREIKKPYVRHNKSHGWYTSDELLISKDNIYLLSAVKKGKCEWICYNTGELIRPDLIFN